MKKIVLLLLTFNLLLFANVAKIVAMNGEATVLRDNNTITLAVGNELLKDDVIQTKENTKIQIIFKDETIVTIGKNSEFKINDYIFDEANQQYSANLGLVQGTFRTITGKIGKVAPEKFKLNSKSSSIGIRGTQILSNVQIQGDTIFCTEGEIEIVSQLTGETITLQAGQFVQIREGEPAVVQEFDAQTINTTDTNTKFLNDEEKEEALENFGVTINQVDPIAVETQEETNNQDNQTQINQTTSNINDTSTYDDLEELTSTTQLNLAGHTSMYDPSGGDYFNSFIIGTYSDEKLAYEDSGNIINLKLDDFITKYNSDGLYSGTLSSSGNQSLYYASNISFESGIYTSVKDNSSNFDTNDDIQWGSWNATFNDLDISSTFDLKGFWLIGNQTKESEVQALINSGIIATYSGYVLAHDSAGQQGPAPIGGGGYTYDSTNSSVSLSIDFGESTIGGTFTLDSSIINVGGSNLDSSGFTMDTASGGGAAWISANGKFYGTNAGSIGGDFKIGFYSDNIVSGVFKAKKQ
ncbi:MAG: FecR domain-containing protein [Sulfurimonadaceae bacterium]